MRRYPKNSCQAAGRLLALAMVVDGNLAPTELAALERSAILPYLELEPPQFHDLLQELCQDMLHTVVHGAVELDRDLIDGLLDEITEPDLRRRLLRAMWHIADADDYLADAEAVLLARACTVWSAESNFVDRAAV